MRCSPSCRSTLTRPPSSPAGPAAIRDVVVNAFVHASYETSGVNFQIAFLDNRIEVASPGTLLPGVTVEEIHRGVSVVRNPTIARFYRELGLVEQWGTGI